MIEYIEWRQKAREIPAEDQSEFYDTPLPHLTVFRYETEKFSLPSHRTHFSLKFTLHGREEYFFGRRRVSLGSGSALFANDGEIHASSAGESVQSLSIYMPPDTVRTLMSTALANAETELDGMARGNALPDVPQVAFPVSSRTEQFLTTFLCGRRDVGADVCDARFEVATLRLAEHALRDVFRLAPPWTLADVAKQSVRDELITRVLRARTFIDDGAGLAYDLDTLAEIACLSKYHLIRLFAEIVGETPGAYARHRRLEAAHQALIRGRDWASVARDAGYSSVRRFRDAYAKLYGGGHTSA